MNKKEMDNERHKEIKEINVKLDLIIEALKNAGLILKGDD